MQAPEGLVRRYVVGLVMETVPGYRCGEGSEPEHRVLPGLLVRDPVLPRRTGAVALQQAVSLLTGERVSVPTVVSAQGLLRHAQRLLPGFNAQWVWEREPSNLLALSHDAVHRGGLVLVLWQSIARQVQGSPRLPCPAPRWMLVVGVEGRWSAVEASPPRKPCALLALNVTVPPAWGSGHNQQLSPGAHLDHTQAVRVEQFRAVWTARSLEGGVDCGFVIAAIVLTPSRVTG